LLAGVPDGYLPGERLLWTGRPTRAGVTLADAGVSVFLLGALAVLAAAWFTGQGGMPESVKAASACVVAIAAVQVVAALAHLLVVKPRLTRREVYQVTSYRVVVITGLGAHRTWSAYLDQIEPAVRRNRDGSEDLLLRAGAPAGLPQNLREALGSVSLVLPAAAAPVPVLRSVDDAAQVQQIASSARRQMLTGMAWAGQLPGGEGAGALPAGISLEPGERALWSGRPARVPWWFGANDVNLSLFALVWLAFVCLLGALVVAAGNAAFLVVIVPLAAAGGVYPAVGRVLHRRMRIRRSTYVVTDRRLVMSWRLGREPVTVEDWLMRLLPPAVRGQAIVTDQANPPERQVSWKHFLWPAATTSPPVLIGIVDTRAACEAIVSAQLALRTKGLRPQQAAPDPD
jgi:hypothetical protein